ncbi:MAG: LamG-like jellyroll fold domain-containing protein [Verrucomicrobiota bacterium]
MAFCLLRSALVCGAATFPGNARVEISDPTGGLSWSNSVGGLTISCWFKLSIPSDADLGGTNLAILVNQRTYPDTGRYAYLIQFNSSTGNVEFAARGSGSSSPFTKALIERPYLERWYHVAVVRRGNVFTGYVDGREVFSEGTSVGDTSTKDGVSVGGWGSGRYLMGEVQEVAIYQAASKPEFIRQYLFADQPTNDLALKGYFKLAFSANVADRLKNFAPAPVPSGTEMASTNGVVEFEEVNQAGEQSTFDSRRNGSRDSITPLSGSFSWQQTALSRPTPGIAFDLRLGYSSANYFNGAKFGTDDPLKDSSFGSGWRHSFEVRLVPSQYLQPGGTLNTIVLLSWDGAAETWDAHRVNGGRDGTYRTRSQEYRGELYVTNGLVEWRTPERLVYRFRDPFDEDNDVMRGRLMEIRDFQSNVVKLLYNEIRGVLTQVVDTVSGTWDFRYQGNFDLLTNVTFGPWQANFAYDTTNRLVSKSITNTSGFYTNVLTTWQFAYGTNGLLARILDPLGHTNVFIQYDQYGRKTNAVDALGRATRTEYGMPAKRQLRHTDPGGQQWVETYDRKGRILAQQDPLTNITTYTYNDRGNRTSITEPLGWKTVFGYDDRANVVARTNALDEVTRWDFHAFFNKVIQQITPQPADTNGWTTWTNFYAYDAVGNLTNHSDALGPLVRYTYRTNGLVETSTDANGNTTRFAYDTNGFLIARTEPFTTNNTVTTTYVVNEVGWRLCETNALGDATAYAYDLNGNPVRVQDVLGRVFRRAYDPNGNLLSTTDGMGQLTTHAYDAANQRTNTTDRTGTNKWLTFYTTRGKVERVTDPLGHTVTNIYDAANRVERISNPLGQTSTNLYDANGNLVAWFDKLGQRWSKTYDRLNRVIADTDPLGNTRQAAYDVAGRLQQSITPNGYPSIHFYDGRGRLTKWKDAEGFDWLYTYDGNGNIVDIEDALHGHYVMAYGPRNERMLERNQDNFEWRYDYDELLRLQRQTDPNGTTRTPDYDPAGRVRLVDFSTLRRDTFDYDDNDNPRTISRRFGGLTTATRFVYDALDRPIEQTDAHAQTVLYGYDPLGRVTSVTYPGSKTLTNIYDPLGRLTNQMDWATRQMSYDYDKAGRLIRRAYPNGVVQTNSFDTAGRITGLSYSSLNPQPSTINIALAYAYDRNGNKVGSSEKGTLQWPLPTLTDEKADYTKSGRLKTRMVEHLPSPGGEGQGEGGTLPATINYSFDPSGNMTNAVKTLSGTNAESWSLTYDEDNRTTSIRYSTAAGTTNIVNRYDALGRRISKTVDGVTTGYVLSLVGGMERILCDLDAAGNVTARYVHGPDLCYRVDAANNVVCYHADAQANIISVTDGGGTNMAQYAYTPYGRSLGSTNLQSQISNPYLFVGSQGVMEELPGLYFMRARYYSADAGVFLSTDPVKSIGPGWQPSLHSYANGNPLSFIDPAGTWSLFASEADVAGLSDQVKAAYWTAYVDGLTETIDLFKEASANAVMIPVDMFLADGKGIASHSIGLLGNLANASGHDKWATAADWTSKSIDVASGLQSLHKVSKNFGQVQRYLGEAIDKTAQNPSFLLNALQRDTSYMSTVKTPLTDGFKGALGALLNSAGTSGAAGGSAGGGGRGTSMANKTVSAANHANQMNAGQQTNPAPPNTISNSSGSSGSGSSAFTRAANSVQQAAISVTQAVRNAATTVAQAVSSAVRSVGNFFSGLFGGRRP